MIALLFLFTAVFILVVMIAWSHLIDAEIENIKRDKVHIIHALAHLQETEELISKKVGGHDHD